MVHSSSDQALCFSQILGQQMEASMREIDFLFLNMKRGNTTESISIDSLQFMHSNQGEESIEDSFETNKEDYELIPGKVAQ